MIPVKKGGGVGPLICSLPKFSKAKTLYVNKCGWTKTLWDHAFLYFC